MTKRGGRIIRGTGDGDGFFIGRTDFAQHPDIPYEVKGLVFDIISRPRNWTVSIPGMLSINKTVGERKLHRMFRDAEQFGVIKGVRRRDAGKLSYIDYYVGQRLAEVDAAIAEDIQRAAEAIAEIIDNLPTSAPSEPHRQNSSVVGDEPHCGFAHVQNGPPNKERTIKKNEYKKEISLSHAAQPAAAAGERDAALARFENVKKAAKWNPQTSFSAALAEFIKLPAQDQERAVDEAPRYERDSKGCDHRVSLNRYIRDCMFDRPKPEEPKPKGMPDVVWNNIQEAKAAKEVGPPPDPAIQWRAYIDKRIANGGRDGRRILKSQIILCLEGSRGWDRANCPLNWVVENYFPDLEHWKPYDKFYAGAL